MKIKFLLLFLIAGILSGHAQNIGIGVDNPVRARLEVNGLPDGNKTVAIFGGESSGVSFQRTPIIGFNEYRDASSTSNRYMSDGFAGIQYFDTAYGQFGFGLAGYGNGNNEATLYQRLAIESNGNMRISNISFNATISTLKNSGAISSAYLFGTTHHSAFNFGAEENTYIRAGKDNGTVFINDIPNGTIVMNGFVGINTATPGYPLELRQANYKGLLLVEESTFNNWGIRVYPNAGDMELAFNETKKGQFNASNGSYVTVSDQRLKTNIQSLPALLEKVMKLEPVEYEMIHDNPKHQRTMGFIAQDVKKFFPEFVTVLPGDSGYEGVKDLHALDYNSFGVLAIKTIQEQQQLIKKQEESIKVLRSKLNNMKKAVNELTIGNAN